MKMTSTLKSNGSDPISILNRDKLGEGADAIFFKDMPPVLRAILFSDGTVTRIMEAFYWEPVKVEVLFHGEVELTHDLLHLDARKGDRLLHRKILVRGLKSKKVYEYAKSFVRVDRLWPSAQTELIEGRLGLGEILSDRQAETYREMLEQFSDRANDLAEVLELNVADHLACRSYCIRIGGMPTVWLEEKYPLKAFQERD